MDNELIYGIIIGVAIVVAVIFIVKYISNNKIIQLKRNEQGLITEIFEKSI